MGPSSSRDARVRAAWEADRGYLLAIAAGMLGRPAEAEDVVQEAFARLAGASIDDIGDVLGWLVVVTRRLCLDRLGSAEARRTTAIPELPEAGQEGVDPADRLTLDDEVRRALAVVVDRLSPAERTSFIFTFPEAAPSLRGRKRTQLQQGAAMRIVIFGANGQTGRLLTEQALAAGHDVAAVTRRPVEFPITHDRLTVVEADVHDAPAVDRAVEGADVVLSALGVPFTRKQITIYSESAGNIIAAMSRHRVKRLIVVSSSATEPHHHADGGFALNRVLQPLVTATIGKTTYADMRRMEDLVRGSDLEWTIMRPSGLFDAPGVTAYELHEDQAPGSFTSRADLAASMLDQATDTRFVRKAAAVTTSEGVPTLFQMIRREALKKK